MIQTPAGNIMWDMIALIDEATVTKINSLGPLKAIVVSHPHYYTTFTSWAAAFPDVPIYFAADDREWVCQEPTANLRFIEGPPGTTQEMVEGVTAIKVGGHFPGSQVLWWNERLFVADSIVTVPVNTSSSIFSRP